MIATLVQIALLHSRQRISSLVRQKGFIFPAIVRLRGTPVESMPLSAIARVRLIYYVESTAPTQLLCSEVVLARARGLHQRLMLTGDVVQDVVARVVTIVQLLFPKQGRCNNLDLIRFKAIFEG